MKGFLLVVFCTLLLTQGCNPPVPSDRQPIFPPTSQLREGGPVEAYANMLRRRVNRNGDVHYAGIQVDDSALRNFVQYLQQRHGLLAKAPEREQLAYWINLYNACAIQLIVDYYPIKSVLDIGYEFDQAVPVDYDLLNSQHPNHPFHLPIITLGQRTYSLRQMRDEVIRPQFKDPRVHFVLVDGTDSSPRLRREVLTQDNIEEILEESTREFVNKPIKNVLNPNEPRLSPLFEMYMADFGGSQAAVVAFVNQYIPVALAPSAQLSYGSWNWLLNGY